MFWLNFIQVCPKGPTVNKSALVQVMAWCQTGTKPLPEPMMNLSTDVYICYELIVKLGAANEASHKEMMY